MQLQMQQRLAARTTSVRPASGCSAVVRRPQQQQQQHRVSVQVQVAAPAAVALKPTSSLQQDSMLAGDDAVSPGWAIVRVGSMQQFLEVGAPVHVPSSLLQPTEGKLVRFTEVLAAKHPLSGQLFRGGPHVVVEGLVLDQFQGPVVPAVQQQQQPVQLSKVLITKIQVGDRQL